MMSTPLKPWESANGLENKAQIVRNSQLPTGTLRSAPVLPPRPQSGMTMTNSYNSSAYSPYSSMGSNYNSYGAYGGGMGGGWPGRSLYGTGYSGYNSYGGYGGMSGMGGYNSYGNSYGMYGNSYGMGADGMGMGIRDDAETRFIQFAEDSSRNTFANVESIVRAFNGIAMMLDNTFFAMTSSFRAVLGVAENFGRLRSMFGHIWQAVSIFRLFTWLHRKLMSLLGVKMAPSNNSLAWNEAVNGMGAEVAGSGGSSWPTLAFFGILFSAPYFIAKLLPKYEDKCDPEKWKSSGIPAKAVFDFAATSTNELTLHTNDEILLAPKAVQEDMRLGNTGWAYATCNNRSGVVPLNYIVIVKRGAPASAPATRPIFPPTPIINNNTNNASRKVQKRVSFGETQIFEPPFDVPIVNATNTNTTPIESEIIHIEPEVDDKSKAEIETPKNIEKFEEIVDSCLVPEIQANDNDNDNVVTEKDTQQPVITQTDTITQ